MSTNDWAIKLAQGAIAKHFVERPDGKRLWPQFGHLKFGSDGDVRLPGGWPLDQFEEWNRRNWALLKE